MPLIGLNGIAGDDSVLAGDSYSNPEVSRDDVVCNRGGDLIRRGIYSTPSVGRNDVVLDGERLSESGDPMARPILYNESPNGDVRPPYADNASPPRALPSMATIGVPSYSGSVVPSMTVLSAKTLGKLV